jgi:hypothetical protein
MEDSLMAEQEPTMIALPIEWHVPEDIVSRYANNIVVQYSQHEFIISFFETLPPLVVGPPEEIEAKLEQTMAAQANCVARIIVAVDKMPGFMQVMQDSLKGYLSHKGLE